MVSSEGRGISLVLKELLKKNSGRLPTPLSYTQALILSANW